MEKEKIYEILFSELVSFIFTIIKDMVAAMPSGLIICFIVMLICYLLIFLLYTKISK